MKLPRNSYNVNDNKANVSASFLTFSSDNLTVNNPLFEGRLELATEGLEPSYFNKLKKLLSKTNALTIANYILAMKTEINLSDSYRMINLKVLVRISQFFRNKISFQTMGRKEILMFLDSYRKTDAVDPIHRWIGTYNLYLVIPVRFFKWLYFPELPPSNREKPAVVENVPGLRRKEQSIYKPSDLWTKEEDVLFLKYCPSKRIRCYHAAARDTSCRPHEILKLRVKDIVFKTYDNYHYAEVLVNGKTGTRSIPLFDSIPYVKDWLDEHPLRGNPNAFLVAGISKSIGRPIEISTGRVNLTIKL
jgi:integrase